MTHPYFIAKAQNFMRTAGASAANVEAMAAWAENAREQVKAAEAQGKTSEEIASLTRRGIIVTPTGDIVAETERARFACEYQKYTLTYGSAKELGFSVGSTVQQLIISRSTLLSIEYKIGRPVAHASYFDLCTGASPRKTSEK